MVAGQDVAGALPGAGRNKLEQHAGLTLKQGRAPARDHREDRQVQFVHQIVRHQIVPEQTTRKHQDVSAPLLFEAGDLPVRLRAGDDAGVLPGSDFLGCEVIRNNDFLDGGDQFGDLPSDRGGVGVRGDTGPVVLEAQGGSAATEQQGVGGT